MWGTSPTRPARRDKPRSLLGRGFLRNHNLQVSRDVLVQLDRDVELTDWSSAAHPAGSCGGRSRSPACQLSRDVARRDRTEELIVLADLALEGDLDSASASQPALGCGLFLHGAANGRFLHLHDDGLVGKVASMARLLRQQVVAAVAVGNLHDVAAMTSFRRLPSE